MESSFLKYFKIIPNTNKCNCIISGCKSQKLTKIKGYLKRHLIDSYPSVAEAINLSVKRTKSLKKRKLSTNDLVRIIAVDRCPMNAMNWNLMKQLISGHDLTVFFLKFSHIT